MSRQDRGLVCLVDWIDGGHNATYLHQYRLALQRLGYCVGIVCSEASERELDTLSGDEEPKPWTSRFVMPGFFPIRPYSVQLYMRQNEISKRIVKGIQSVEKHFKRKSELVFFTTLFENDSPLVLGVLNRLERRFGALYLHPRRFAFPNGDRITSLERLLRHERLKCLGTLNEDLADTMEKELSKQVIVFPDVTDQRHDPNHPLIQKIRKFADGRTVVGLISLAPWKGVGLVSRVCPKIDPNRFVFFFAGQYSPGAYTETDRKSFEACVLRQPHVISHLTRLCDGYDYNAALDSCDIITCVCDNFPYSNNTLTKTALLKRPIIVTRDSLTGRRVEQYGLGVSISSDDDSLSSAIESLSKGRCVDHHGASCYVEQHGIDALMRSLTQAMC